MVLRQNKRNFSVCLNIVYFAENWKLIIENNKKIIYGLLFTAENTAALL